MAPYRFVDGESLEDLICGAFALIDCLGENVVAPFLEPKLTDDTQDSDKRSNDRGRFVTGFREAYGTYYAWQDDQKRSTSSKVCGPDVASEPGYTASPQRRWAAGTFFEHLGTFARSGRAEARIPSARQLVTAAEGLTQTTLGPRGPGPEYRAEIVGLPAMELLPFATFTIPRAQVEKRGFPVAVDRYFIDLAEFTRPGQLSFPRIVEAFATVGASTTATGRAMGSQLIQRCRIHASIPAGESDSPYERVLGSSTCAARWTANRLSRAATCA